MTEIFGYNREAVRVKVKKCEPNIPPEWRKFSVDPQITSLEVLYSILAKAFDIKSDFSICYKTLDPTGHEAYLSVLSDWELDAAFSKAHNISIQTGNEPCLNLRVDIKAFSEATDWEVSSQITKEISSLQQSFGVGQKYVQNMQNKLPGLIMNQMEKTFSMVQRALNLNDDQILSQPLRPPLSDSEFRSFLDSVGQILRPHELRRVIFAGGIDPSLRKVVWKHILNVYPTGMTGKERMDYMKRKAGEYYRLREIWKSAVQRGPVTGELAYVTSMVRKDVLRTDRLHSFYAGSDDNQNIASLFNILTTYALNHPSVSYCQGMSDIASPLLVTMSDEAHAYICFCAIMGRLKANFMLDGIAMTLKFTHLAEALHFYDPEFYSYLKLQQADDLLFCYRWLLLEMKREFAFDDSLRMLEVLWSSLRYEPPTKELSLFEKEFEPSPPDIPPPKSPSVILRTPRENHYTKVCALRRQSSSVSLLSSSPNSINSSLSSVFSSYGGSIGGKLNATRRLNHSLDENISRLPRTKSVKAHQSLDETKMIMLMENMAMLENKLTTEITQQQQQQQQQKLQNKESQQQQHQNNEETITMNNQEINQKIIFHPTNPFIHDSNSELRQHDENKNESNNRIKCSTNIDDNLSNDSSEERTLSPKRDFKYKNQKNNLKLQNKNIFSCNANNISKQLTNKKGGHFKELKEKIAASKKGILASLDKIESQFEVTSKQAQNLSNSQILDDSLKCDNTIITTTTTTSSASSKGQKVVKNFNEFLNFASINKSRISDKLVTNNKINSTFNSNNNKDIIKDNGINKHRPLIKLTKNSFDDSDSSVTCETEVSQLQPQQQNQTISVQPSITSITTVTTTTTEISSKQPLQLHLTNIVAQTQQNLDGSSPDDSQDYYPMTTSMTRELRLELENLDRQVFGNAGILERNKFLNEDITDIEYEKLDKDSLDMLEVRGEEIISCPDLNEIIVMRNNQEKKNITSNNDPLKRISTCSTGTDIFIWENPLHQISGASSCNFNEIIENDDENAIIKNENGISRCDDDGCGYIDDNNKINSVQQTALTPDEQQELEYDGEIIIESEFKKSVTPLKLVQTTTTTTSSSASLHSTKLHDYDNSDSDNTDSWKKSDNLNPFLQSKSSSIIDRFEAQKEQQQQQQQEQQLKKKLPQQQPKIQNHVLSVFVEQPPQQLQQQQQNQNLQSTELINNSISSSAANITTNLQQTTVEEASETNIINLTTSKTTINNILPPPDEFGGGNPFLMFLCLTLLLQHRNYVIKNAMDYNEMAMHFDKMVRKHDVNRVLNQARRMYFEYLKTQNALISSSLTLNSNSDTFHGHSNKL